MMKLRLIFILTLYIINNLCAQDALMNAMDKYRDTLISQNYGMVGLYKHGDTIEKYAIGKAGDSIKMTNDKVFNIGSFTKTFTAVLILQEVEKGNISLDDSVYHFFPKELVYNKNVNLDITIEQLLRHRSGLGEIVIDTIVNEAFYNPYHEYNNTLLYNKIPEPISEPGTEYRYCNTNYILLGYILEVLNDLPYAELLRNRIFKPCNMVNSYPYYSKSIENIAHPMSHGRDLLPYSFFPYYRNYAFSAGCISSSLDDLYNFFQCLFIKKSLIDQESLDKMLDFMDNYGLGMMKFNFNGITYYGHGGDDIGFRVRDYYNPENGDILILMSNQFADPYVLKVRELLL